MKTKRASKVEFYKSKAYPTDVSTPRHEDGQIAVPRLAYGWRLQAPNGQIICTLHETFTRHRDAVRSFTACANAMDARNVFEVTGFAPEESHRLLVGMR